MSNKIKWILSSNVRTKGCTNFSVVDTTYNFITACPITELPLGADSWLSFLAFSELPSSLLRGMSYKLPAWIK